MVILPVYITHVQKSNMLRAAMRIPRNEPRCPFSVGIERLAVLAQDGVIFKADTAMVCREDTDALTVVEESLHGICDPSWT